MIPAGSSKTIGDLVEDVVEALQNRADVASIAPKYLRKALIELTESYPFEELRVTGPNVSLTAGQTIYPVSFFLNPGDDYSMPEAFAVYIDYPNDMVSNTLNYKTPRAIEDMISPATQGIPAWFTRFGANFHLGPTPISPFTSYLRYQRKHPFPDDEAAISGQPLYIPNSWEDIAVYAAAERIAIVKRWNDQQQTLHQLLYGDPEFQMSEGKRGRPGLVAARVFQIERDQRNNSRQLSIRVGRYNGR